MSEIQNKIEKLKTIQESMDVLTDSLVANPVAKESTIITESQSIKDKIDNIKLPEVDLSSVAKQGENQEATNSKILEEVQNKLTPLEAVLTELDNGKKEMVDAIKAKGGNSNADKSLSEIAEDVRNISNIDKTFNNVDFFMAQYGLSMSPLQLIYKHFDSEYSTYVCYVVDADTKINVQRSAYVMFTADGAFENPEGEYIIPEWENRFGYFIFAYKNNAVTWEDYGAYFIGMYGATTTLDNRTLTNFLGFQCDKSDVILSASCFASRTLCFLDLGESNVSVYGDSHFANCPLGYINLPQIKICNGRFLIYESKCSILNMENLEYTVNQFLRSDVKKVILNQLKRIGTQGLFYMKKITELYLPSLLTASDTDCVASLSSLKKFYAPISTIVSNTYIFESCPNLIDIEVGELYSNTTWQNWNPTNVLADAELTLQLDKNIREHVAMKIKDLTGETAQTFTFSQNVRNIMSAETEAVFAAKNWNISPAKSV